MKTKEYIEIMEALDFVGDVVETDFFVYVRNEYGDVLMDIDKGGVFSVNVKQNNYDKLDESDKSDLINLTIPYLSTTPEERKEEKRYYARSKFTSTGDNYLNLFDSGNTDLITKFGPQGVQTKFTINELKGLGIQFDENDEPYEWSLVEVSE